MKNQRIVLIGITIVFVAGIIWAMVRVNIHPADQYGAKLLGKSPEQVVETLGPPYWDSRQSSPESASYSFLYSWSSGRGIAIRFEKGVATEVRRADK